MKDLFCCCFVFFGQSDLYLPFWGSGRLASVDWEAWASGAHFFRPGGLRYSMLKVGCTNGGFCLGCPCRFSLLWSSTGLFLLGCGVRMLRSGPRAFLRFGSSASQDSSHVGNGGVGVVSMQGAPLALPTFATAQFQRFFDCGRGGSVYASSWFWTVHALGCLVRLSGC